MFVEKIRWLIAPAIALTCVGGTLALQWSQMKTIQTKQTQTQPLQVYQFEEKQYEASLAFLNRMPTLGYDNLVADWTFLNFIQYFGDEQARHKTGFRLTPKFFEIIVDKDPRFLDMYPYLSSTVTLYGGNPIKTVALLEKGLKSIPESMQSEAYFLWQAKGTDELLFLGNPQAARQSYLKAAEWASRSEDPEIQAITQRTRETADFLAKNPDSKRAQIAAWMNILLNAIDQPTRQFAISQVQKLGAVLKEKDGVWTVEIVDPASAN
jgi:hypothetical protein